MQYVGIEGLLFFLQKLQLRLRRFKLRRRVGFISHTICQIKSDYNDHMISPLSLAAERISRRVKLQLLLLMFERSLDAESILLIDQQI